MSFITDWIRKVVLPDINNATEKLNEKVCSDIGKTAQGLAERADLTNHLLAERIGTVEKAPQTVRADFLVLKADLRESVSKALADDMDEIQGRIGKLEGNLREAVREAEITLKRMLTLNADTAGNLDRRDRGIGKTIDGRYETRIKAIEQAQDYVLGRAQGAIEEAQAVLVTAKAMLDAANRGLQSCAAFNAKFNILDDKLIDLGKRLTKAEAAIVVPKAEKPVAAAKK
jgi:hypothetical protein